MLEKIAATTSNKNSEGKLRSPISKIFSKKTPGRPRVFFEIAVEGEEKINVRWHENNRAEKGKPAKVFFW